MSERLRESDESCKIENAKNGISWIFSRDQHILRIFAAIGIGLLQGIAFFFMIKSSSQWCWWYITASMLPLPVFLARDFLTMRTAAALILWAGLLILLDAGQIFFRNPYSYGRSTDFAIFVMACIGALMTLPNFVAWIDGDGALPEWQTSFKILSRILFASAIAGLFAFLFWAIFGIGGALANILGGFFARIAKWIFRNFEIVVFAAWGAAFCWAADARKLIDVLERYILAVCSCLMPLTSVFTVLCVAALPIGVERLWGRGLNSGVVLSFFLVSGFCSFAAWQGGVGDGGHLREPFFRPLNTVVKAALILLPIFSPLLVYAIGLRIRQYSLTVDRAIGMMLAIIFGLWSLTWAFFLVRRWRTWPIFYGKTNRIVFPALGMVLILISSPICDVRKIVLHERLEWLKRSILEGSNIDKFDWRYIALNLGSYGVKVIEELEAGGEEAIYAKFGPFESEEQAVRVQGKISAEVALIKRLYEPREKAAKMSYEDFIRSIREAPVFGGTLTPDERESLVRGAERDLGRFSSGADDGKAEFFFLTDMDGDGEPDVLMGVGSDIYLMRMNRAFLLERRTMSYTGNQPDNKAAISENRQRKIKNQWDIIRINDTLFSVNPRDAETIDSVREPQIGVE